MLQRFIPRLLGSPVRISMDFEDRPLRLGKKISITLELHARRGVEVKEGRVDLVCEERYMKSYTRMVGIIPGAGLITPRSGNAPATDFYPMREAKEHTESYVHSSVVFLKDTRMRPGTVGEYRARLEIQPEPPLHGKEGTLTWTLKAAVDISRKRDVTAAREVTVSLT